MAFHTFSGEHSWTIFDIADNLPDNFSAKTDYDSPTRQVFNVIAAIPINEGLQRQESILYERLGSIVNQREVGYVTMYDVETPSHPENDNYIWNSQFDVPYGTLPEYWLTNGSISLTSESMLGLNGCSISNSSYIEQTVRLPHYGGTWYVGLYSKAAANFTVTVSWTGSSSTKTVAGTNQWRKTSWSFSVPATINEITIRVNGTCVCDRIYVSHNNEYTHCNYDKPWFMNELSEGALYYGIDGSTTERVFVYDLEENMLNSYPLYATTTTDTRRYQYQSIAISGETAVALSLIPNYMTLSSLVTKLESDYGNTFSIRMHKNGTWYDDTNNPLEQIDHTRALYISSDSPVTITLRGSQLPVYTNTFLTSSEYLNYYDTRFDSAADLLDHYNCEYTGDASATTHQIVSLTDTHGSIRLCNPPNAPLEPVITNTRYGYVRGEFGTKFDLDWEYDTTTISCSPVNLNDYVVESATLAEFYSYDHDSKDITLNDITGYEIKGLLIDGTGVMYILTNETTPVLYISDVCFVKPNQTHIPVLSKIELPDVSIDFSSDYVFALHAFSHELHIEDKDGAYKISLEYPYGTWSNNSFITRIQYDNISVVANDHSNTH